MKERNQQAGDGLQFDNRASSEAKQTLSSSEMIRTVVQFAEYIEKEYTSEGDDRAMFIAAMDADMPGLSGRMSLFTNAIGQRGGVLYALVKAMRNNEGVRDLLNEARVLSLTDPDSTGDLADRLADTRRRERLTWGYVAICALWTLTLAAGWALGLFHALTTVSSLLLMAFLFWLIGRELKALRRQRRRYQQAAGEDREQHRKMAAATFMHMLKQAAGRAAEDDDD